MLQIRNFRKAYGRFTVLSIDELAIKPGVFWVRGANGTGKSTLLKAAAGILDFDGEISLGGKISLKKDPVEYRRRVNFAEAEPVFPDFLTGKEMLHLFASAKRAPARQQDYLVDSMHMNAYVNEPLSTYSSGMLKKLSLALAFLGKPDVILLDEPLITMDTVSLQVLYRWIEEKHRDESVSFFLSSHQPLETQVTDTLTVENQTVTANA
ncbi:ABC-2 type transport system ATP-binding protein [Chryseolinea serpens]|uniref:ABC-2 type transport system ATP-binding protein n=1 Tax=Chryseolinea serpens TaxID=947013 RepID=A0A1M5JMB4_9BACT|nr:ABC transporter ATP-binding protein [Chryseolinea serpens]SHG41661.1 ABC-2 type transport system ATP-binding protein [Chryseolinea serpens]